MYIFITVVLQFVKIASTENYDHYLIDKFLYKMVQGNITLNKYYTIVCSCEEIKIGNISITYSTKNIATIICD